MSSPDTFFSKLLQKIRPEVEQNIALLGGPWPAFTLFLSFSDGRQRARVIHASSALLDHAWLTLQSEGEKQSARHGIDVRWLRIDWVTHAQQLDWKTVRASLKAFKRNYFRNGLALDTDFEVAFLEQELNANAMLYGGNQWSHAVLNEKNFAIYARKRFPGRVPDFSDDAVVCIFGTRGVFCELDSAPVQLYASGNNAGRRIVDNLDADRVGGLIARGSRYLASQVQSTGRFHYGWHPCFDRPINTYNSLRHASTLYSMLEAWEVTGDPALAAAIDRGLAYLVGALIKCIALDDGDMAAFLVDRPDEIKLGGNAVCLLALTKHEELFGTGRYLELLEQLALGIRFMQDPHSGGFVHVLHYPGLEVKEPFRIIYYDGEAAFGLMRLYRLSGDPRWLAMVEKAFDRFIEAEHWKAHDHWLSYCVNELTLCRPDERYYRFGIQNVAGHLGFVRTRITTFPTLLELMMAAKAMIARMLERGEHLHLLKELDLGKFEDALEFRARYLMNGHFWPEYAMYFKNPQRILGSFFIRHHAFRVRIDDVEHYLSGYVAYLKQLIEPSWEIAAMTDSNGSDDGKGSGDALTTGQFMYAKLADFQIDVEKLRAHFMQDVRAVAPTAYRDNQVDYIGWAVTSRDGTLEDGVRRISTRASKNNKRGVAPTDICTDYLAEVMASLEAYGLSPYRARIMELHSEGTEMPFHTDASSETWRLHIPIITNDNSCFEWQRPDGSIESVHLPADGSAWLVRVDLDHRALNRKAGDSGRVHLLMGLNKKPQLKMLAPPWEPLQS